MKCPQLLIAAVLCICVTGTADQPEMSNIITAVLKYFWTTGVLPDFILGIFKDQDLGSTMTSGVAQEEWSDERKLLFCSMCSDIADEVLIFYRDPAFNKETISRRLITLCSVFASDDFCSVGMDKFEPLFTRIFHNETDTNGQDICGMAFMQLGCRSTHPKREWTVAMPNTLKPPTDNTPYPKPSEVPTSKILFLSDIHHDKNYVTGSNADCDNPDLCCHEDSSGNRTDGDEAGYWGDYRVCDIPKRTIELLLKDAADRHPDVDAIVTLGDYVSHRLKDITKESVLETITETFDLIEMYFPGKTIIPVIGNHDVDPVNTFAPIYITDVELSTNWLYSNLSVVWDKWLPQDAKETFTRGGYYSTLIKPGLRAISMNTNYCYAYNWWLILDSEDVAQNLQFLANELQKAEEANESVYVLSHMSPGYVECDHMWSGEFNKIINRYENTVTALFHGHSHNDHFEVYFDSVETTRPYVVGYTIPSMTTYVGLNPGYTVHISEGDFDGSQHRILDTESYILDLEAANVDDSITPITHHLYSAIEEYNLADMSPQSMLILLKCMTMEGNTLFEDYHRNFYKDGIDANRPCNDTCKQQLLCSNLHTDRTNSGQCGVLDAEWNSFKTRSTTDSVYCGEICYKNCQTESAAPEPVTVPEPSESVPSVDDKTVSEDSAATTGINPVNEDNTLSTVEIATINRDNTSSSAEIAPTEDLQTIEVEGNLPESKLEYEIVVQPTMAESPPVADTPLESTDDTKDTETPEVDEEEDTEDIERPEDPENLDDPEKSTVAAANCLKDTYSINGFIICETLVVLFMLCLV